MPFGKYKFLQVPFGLAQAPAFFQHLMNKVLDNCPFAMMYLDDIIIFSDTEEEHFAHVEEIFKRLVNGPVTIIPSFPTWEQHAHSVQNARSRFTKLNQSYSC